MSAAKIRFENVSEEFTVRADDGGAAKRFVAVHEVTLDVKPGEFLVLVGPAAAASPRCWTCWPAWRCPPAAAC